VLVPLLGPSSVIMPQVEGGFRKWNDAGHGLDDAPARQPGVEPRETFRRGGRILVVGRRAPRAGFAALSFMQIATVAVLMISACAWAEPVRIAWSTPVVAALAVTGLLCNALAFSVQAWAQRRISATRTALIFALEPVAAWLTAWLVTGESLTISAATGGVLILTGVLVAGIETRPTRPASMDIGSQSSYNKNSAASGRQNENDFV